jgi:hypothetical protein
MHKRIQVAVLNIDEDTGVISSVGECFAAEHLPVGVTFMNGKPNKGTLNDWWVGRSIPASRSGLRQALEILDISYPQKLLTKCLGLSLSDQYWICPADKSVEWGEVNFFENTFSDDVGDALFGKKPQKGDLDLESPDNTSDGWLQKKWKIIDGKRCLIKGGSDLFRQEPLNEVIAAAICRSLDIPHVPYTVIWEDENPYSVCPDFITADTELVSAWNIMKTQKKINSRNNYQHLLLCCESLGITGMREHIDRMLVLDFLLVNEDRHFNNFGAVRNAETLEWIGSAPIYDSGTSLWYSSKTIGHRGIESKPFKGSHDEQIKLVTSFGWLDFSALDGIEDEIDEILSTSPFIDESRKKALIHAINRQIELLQSYVNQFEQSNDESEEEQNFGGMTM